MQYVAALYMLDLAPYELVPAKESTRTRSYAGKGETTPCCTLLLPDASCAACTTLYFTLFFFFVFLYAAASASVRDFRKYSSLDGPEYVIFLCVHATARDVAPTD